MSEYQKPKYKDAALKKQGSLTIWIDPTLIWYAPLLGKKSRSVTYTD